jgi:hypothetical protein
MKSDFRVTLSFSKTLLGLKSRQEFRKRQTTFLAQPENRNFQIGKISNSFVLIHNFQIFTSNLTNPKYITEAIR